MSSKLGDVAAVKRPGGSRPLRVLHVYRTYFPDPPGGLQEAIRAGKVIDVFPYRRKEQADKEY